MLKRSERQAEIRQTLKRKKRQRILIVGSIMVIVIGLFACGCFFMIRALKNGVFNVKNIKVIGNEFTSEENIADAAGLAIDQSIFLVNYNEIKANIGKTMKTSELSVTPSFPDTIIIRIKECAAICATIENDKIYYIDSDRKIIGIMDHIGKANIPIVSGFDSMQELKLGDQASFASDQRFDEIEKMLKLLNGSGYVDKISEIIVTTNHRYKIISNNNVTFIVPNFEVFNNNYDYIGTILSENYSGLEIRLATDANPVLKEK